MGGRRQKLAIVRNCTLIEPINILPLLYQLSLPYWYYILHFHCTTGCTWYCLQYRMDQWTVVGMNEKQKKSIGASAIYRWSRTYGDGTYIWGTADTIAAVILREKAFWETFPCHFTNFNRVSCILWTVGVIEDAHYDGTIFTKWAHPKRFVPVRHFTTFDVFREIRCVTAGTDASIVVAFVRVGRAIKGRGSNSFSIIVCVVFVCFIGIIC
jgi:hypothetical protein